MGCFLAPGGFTFQLQCLFRAHSKLTFYQTIAVPTAAHCCFRPQKEIYPPALLALKSSNESNFRLGAPGAAAGAAAPGRESPRDGGAL
jgi:hypothetical protein